MAEARMTERSKPTCCIMSYDFLDLDVWLNTRLFYQAAGYRVITNQMRMEADLLVVLRGDPKEPVRGYRGPVHVYDYVKRQDFDWTFEYPDASQITLISLTLPQHAGNVVFVEGFVPVFPQIWQRTGEQKSNQPVHVANYKPMPEDGYQQQLASLARTGKIKVFGGNWEKLGLRTQSLSYWDANRLLARSLLCYGLMYPYQRGITLSGRMWQAPLQGCHVVTESGTNQIGCPGLLETESYDPEVFWPTPSPADAAALAQGAATFWSDQTKTLADRLGLVLRTEKMQTLIQRARARLWIHHLQYHYSHWIKAIKSLPERLRSAIGLADRKASNLNRE